MFGGGYSISKTGIFLNPAFSPENIWCTFSKILYKISELSSYSEMIRQYVNLVEQMLSKRYLKYNSKTLVNISDANENVTLTI